MTEIGNRQALDLEALKELADKASAGPWDVDPSRWSPPAWPDGTAYLRVVNGESNPISGIRSPIVSTAGAPEGDKVDRQHYYDARFIAAARSAVPALIAEVERLRGISAALFEELAVKDQAIEDIRALHSEFRIYEPCDCGHSDEAVLAGDAVDTGEFIACEKTYQYSICRDCCTCDEYDYERTECCVDHHYHHKDAPICDTQRVLADLSARLDQDNEAQAVVRRGCAWCDTEAVPGAVGRNGWPICAAHKAEQDKARPLVGDEGEQQQ